MMPRSVVFVLLLATLVVSSTRDAPAFTHIVKPGEALAQIAERVSVGERGVPEFAESGGAEIAILARAFNRMRRSLDKALKLLDT